MGVIVNKLVLFLLSLIALPLTAMDGGAPRNDGWFAWLFPSVAGFIMGDIERRVRRISFERPARISKAAEAEKKRLSR